jgi:hypothetical protein
VNVFGVTPLGYRWRMRRCKNASRGGIAAP